MVDAKAETGESPVWCRRRRVSAGPVFPAGRDRPRSGCRPCSRGGRLMALALTPRMISGDRSFQISLRPEHQESMGACPLLRRAALVERNLVRQSNPGLGDRLPARPRSLPADRVVAALSQAAVDEATVGLARPAPPEQRTHEAGGGAGGGAERGPGAPPAEDRAADGAGRPADRAADRGTAR